MHSKNTIGEFPRLDAEEVSDYLYEEGCTDGLPIIPPTPGKVENMLKGTRLASSDLVAELPPRRGEATVEKIAINAVMAGCKPNHFPAVLAAIKALSIGDYWADKPKFVLSAVLATAHNCAPALIFSGPLVKTFGIYTGTGCMGPGFRANAAIGRAVQLCLRNIGNSKPGETAFSVLGQTGDYTCCLAENEEALPTNWEPLRVDRGFDQTTTTVTVVAIEPPYHVHDQMSQTPEDLALMFACAFRRPGFINIGYPGEVLLLISPEHGARLARTGWTKHDIKEFIYEHARVPVDMVASEFIRLKEGVEIVRGRGPLEFREWPNWVVAGGTVPLVRNLDDILITVVGGPGPISMVAGSWTHSESSTLAVDPFFPV